MLENTVLLFTEFYNTACPYCRVEDKLLASLETK